MLTFASHTSRSAKGTMQIVGAHLTEYLPTIRSLFTEYAKEIEVDLCFQSFDRELAGLPGQYAPPHGRLYLALEAGAPAGCVALRKVREDICEMKRLYVRPAFRKQGLGRQLSIRAIAAARDIGYACLRLDTLASMKPAIALYESLGFQRIAPYYHNPLGCAVFMELALR
jgi:putative acetyltransferase